MKTVWKTWVTVSVKTSLTQLIYLRDFEVVVCPKRSGTEFSEITVEDAATSLVEVHVSPLDADRHFAHPIRLLRRHELEKTFHVLICFVFRFGLVEKEFIGASEIFTSVIHSRIK